MAYSRYLNNLILHHLAVTILCGVYALPALGQATRTWVSGVGDDVNPCSRTAPCKTFAGAISKTAAGGEISVLDPGGFGSLTITKSIIINGTGSLASILAGSGSDGIIVNATASDKVILCNLGIDGIGAGANGVRLLAAGQLVIDHCTISGFTGQGLDVAVAASTRLMMYDTDVRQSGGAAANFSSTGGTVSALLARSSFDNSQYGVRISSGDIKLQLEECSLTGNVSHGLLVASTTGEVNMENSTIAFNGMAVDATASGAVIRLAENAIYNNAPNLLDSFLKLYLPIIYR